MSEDDIDPDSIDSGDVFTALQVLERIRYHEVDSDHRQSIENIQREIADAFDFDMNVEGPTREELETARRVIGAIDPKEVAALIDRESYEIEKTIRRGESWLDNAEEQMEHTTMWDWGGE